MCAFTAICDETTDTSGGFFRRFLCVCFCVLYSLLAHGIINTNRTHVRKKDVETMNLTPEQIKAAKAARREYYREKRAARKAANPEYYRDKQREYELRYWARRAERESVNREHR